MGTPIEVTLAVRDEILRRINAAATLARDKQWAQALAGYQGVFDPMPTGEEVPSTPKLRADLACRRANALEELGRREEALSILNAELTSLPPTEHEAELDLVLSRGKLLAHAGQQDEMVSAHSAALRAVDEKLDGESGRRVRVVHQLLSELVELKTWALLLETARGLVAYAREKRDLLVEMEASWWVPVAYRGLGQVAQARNHAQVILDAMRRGQHSDAILEWEGFIEGLTPPRKWWALW